METFLSSDRPLPAKLKAEEFQHQLLLSPEIPGKYINSMSSIAPISHEKITRMPLIILAMLGTTGIDSGSIAVAEVQRVWYTALTMFDHFKGYI